jgi:hypothetical protein
MSHGCRCECHTKLIGLNCGCFILRTSATASENIPTTLNSDDLLFQNTCGTPTSELERSALQDFTNRWDGNVDGIGSGF